MIIRKDKYNFDPKIHDGGVYWEYEINVDHLFILKFGNRDTDDGTKEANKMQNKLLEMSYEAFSASTN